MLKADLHIHSAEDPQDRGFTYDARQLVDRAAALGFDAIAVTLHNKVLEDKGVSAHARARGIVLIPGCEADIEDKHVLLYNITEQERLSLRTFDDLRRLRSRRGTGILAVAAHPCFPHKNSLGARLARRHADCFDAVELSQYDHPFLGFNAQSVRLARALGKPLVAGSDAHSLRFFGNAHTFIDAGKGVASILHAVRAGATMPVVRPLPLADFIRIGISIGWMRLRHALGFHGDYVF